MAKGPAALREIVTRDGATRICWCRWSGDVLRCSPPWTRDGFYWPPFRLHRQDVVEIRTLSVSEHARAVLDRHFHGSVLHLPHFSPAPGPPTDVLHELPSWR